mmetsp:Transcript_1899/g.4463  ORF Transcript_1899/g.4463 Transcript_1899/m.4463 type:complete len:317 (+) Transcript_1899:1453-2403(+)
MDSLVGEAHPGLASQRERALVLLLDPRLDLTEEASDQCLHAHILLTLPEQELCGRLLGAVNTGILHDRDSAMRHADIDECDHALGHFLREKLGTLAVNKSGRHCVGMAHNARTLQVCDAQGILHSGDFLRSQIIGDGDAELLRPRRLASGITAKCAQQSAKRPGRRQRKLLVVESDGAYRAIVLRVEQPIVAIRTPFRSFGVVQQKRQIGDRLFRCAGHATLGGNADMALLVIVRNGCRRGSAGHVVRGHCNGEAVRRWRRCDRARHTEIDADEGSRLRHRGEGRWHFPCGRHVSDKRYEGGNVCHKLFNPEPEAA